MPTTYEYICFDVQVRRGRRPIPQNHYDFAVHIVHKKYSTELQDRIRGRRLTNQREEISVFSIRYTLDESESSKSRFWSRSLFRVEELKQDRFRTTKRVVAR